MGNAETCSEQNNKPAAFVKLRVSNPPEPLVDIPKHSSDGLPIPEPSKEADSVSSGHERRMPVVKIRVRQSATSSRAEEADNTVDRSHGGQNETERGASSSMSVDAPPRVNNEPVSTSNQNLEEVNSCHDHGSRMTASIGSAKLVNDDDDMGKELQCTADSRKDAAQLQFEDRSSLGIIKGNNGETGPGLKYASLQNLSVGRHDQDGVSVSMRGSHSRDKEKERKKKVKEKKRKREDKEEHKGHRDDPKYLEQKRLKKEKKQKEKELAKLLSGEAKASSVELQSTKEELRVKSATVELKQTERSGSKVVIKSVETRGEASEGAHKLRIKFKNRSLNR